MNQFKTTLMGAVLALLPTLATANCTDLNEAVLTSDQTAQTDNIQLGLRTAIDDSNPLLSDSWIGVYTRARLVEFCGNFPVPSTVNQVDGTLALAAEYGTLAQRIPDWAEITGDASFATRILPSDDRPFNTGILPMLGPPAVIADYLAGQTGATDCSTLTDADLPAGAQSGQLVLNGLDPDTWPDAATTCTIMNGAGGAASTISTLQSIGYLEAQLPGSINQVLSSDFALWLGEKIDNRGLRLAGSDLALVSLILEYRAENRATASRDFSAIYKTLPNSCGIATGGTSITDYISFDEAALAGFVAPVDVNALLAELMGQTFDSADALIQAIDGLLTGQVNACTRDQIMLAATSTENFGQAFVLNAEKAANLTLQEDFADNAAAVAPFIGLTAPSRGALLSGVRAALQSVADERLTAQVEAAADILASAAEPLPNTFDTLPNGVPAFEPLPQNPTIGVTEATDSAVAATVTDPDFRDALLGANYQPAPNAEVLKSDARKLLGPIAADKAATIVNRAMIQLQPTVDTSWGLTDTLSAAIAAAPAAQGVPDAVQSDETTQALNALVGVEYPNARLLDAALARITSEALANDIRTKASRFVPDTNAAFDPAIALPDCGCVNRRIDNAVVYGFYPFWMAPPAPNGETEEETAIGRMVDFGIVSRIAFYGLEYRITSSGTLFLQNEDQWESGRRTFINAAHRHRTKTDLAIKLTDWDTWSDVQIATAVQRILSITLPVAHADSRKLSALWDAFPTALERMQVDGVTLIVDGYDGTQASVPNIERLESLIRLLQAELAERDQSLNLAFDLNIGASAADDPLFDDIESLLTGVNPIVENVLIFLERPTTDTKKTLRARMENSTFRGIERTRVLRRIIPVLPPAGHKNVFQSAATDRDNTADTAPPGTFSQFTDDLVYFHDNFAGVGFWPTPDPANTEAAAINAIFEDLWFTPTLPAFLGNFEDDADNACTYICPNRTYFAAVAALVFLMTVLLIWRSFYSGFVDKLAFRFGFAWIGCGVIFAILLALAICDDTATWPPLMLLAMTVGVVLLILFNIYQGAKNGPKP